MSDDQLSQHELTVLEALKQSLELDDPASVVRFAAEAQALDGPTRRWWSPLWWLHRWRNREADPWAGPAWSPHDRRPLPPHARRTPGARPVVVVRPPGARVRWWTGCD